MTTETTENTTTERVNPIKNLSEGLVELDKNVVKAFEDAVSSFSPSLAKTMVTLDRNTKKLVFGFWKGVLNVPARKPEIEEFEQE